MGIVYGVGEEESSIFFMQFVLFYCNFSVFHSLRFYRPMFVLFGFVGSISMSSLGVVESKFFTPHGFISLATRTISILSWILGESILKPKRVLIHKNDVKAHGPKLMAV